MNRNWIYFSSHFFLSVQRKSNKQRPWRIIAFLKKHFSWLGILWVADMSQVFWSQISFSLSLGFKIQSDYMNCKILISGFSMYVQHFSPKNLVVAGIRPQYSRSYNCHSKLFGHSKMSNLKQLGLFLRGLAAANDSIKGKFNLCPRNY